MAASESNGGCDAEKQYPENQTSKNKLSLQKKKNVKLNTLYIFERILKFTRYI